MPNCWRRFAILALPLILMVILTVHLMSGMSFSAAGTVLPGVKVLHTDLSKLNLEQAREELLKLETSLKQPVTVQYRGLEWQLPIEQVGLRLDCDGEVHRALAIGRQGSLWQRFTERRQAHRGLNLEPQVFLDPVLLEKAVIDVAGEIILPPRDAGLVINPDNTVEILPGHSGRLLDVEDLEKGIKQAVLTGNQQVELKLIDVAPARSTEEVKAMGVNTLLGSFTTQFDPTNVNRTYNVSVAAAAMDGQIISPQEVFSFNEIVGPRSTDSGYKNAPIIVNNELVDGLGGGVCQVSTTLYNAVLLANLEIVSRTNHSIPVPYVPIGRDATVVFEYIDFKFKNNTDYWLYIQSYVSGGNLTVKLFGNDKFKRDVVIRSWIEETFEPETIVEQDFSIKKGDRVVKQRGSQGFLAAAERVVLENGQVIKVEKLPNSKYNVVNEIISEGMAAPGTLVLNQETGRLIPVHDGN